MLIEIAILQEVLSRSSVEQARAADLLLFYKHNCEHNSAHFKWMEEGEIRDKLQQTQARRAYIDCNQHKQFCLEHNVYNLPLIVKSQGGKFQPVQIETGRETGLKQFHPGNAASLVRSNETLYLYLSQYPLQRLDSRVFWLNSSSEFGRQHMAWLGEGLWAVQFTERIRRFNLLNKFDLIQNYGSLQQYRKSQKASGKHGLALSYQDLQLRMLLADRHTLLLLYTHHCKHSAYTNLLESEQKQGLRSGLLLVQPQSQRGRLQCRQSPPSSTGRKGAAGYFQRQAEVEGYHKLGPLKRGLIILKLFHRRLEGKGQDQRDSLQASQIPSHRILKSQFYIYN